MKSRNGKKEDMSLSTQILKLVVGKCRKDLILDTFRKWNRLPEQAILNKVKKGRSKAEIALILTEIAKEQEMELSNEIMGELELSHMQLHSSSKVWKVFKLLGPEIKLSHDTRIIRSRLVNSIQMHWKHGQVHGNTGFHDGGIWCRIHLSTSLSRKKTDRNLYHPADSVFMVIFSRSPYILISQCRLSIFSALSAGLIKVFEADRLLDIKLSGRHVSSLADIALDKNAQASIDKYRKKEQNELNAVLKRKPQEETEGRDDILDVNRAEKQMRLLEVETKFGPEPQPILETLDFKFDVPVQGNQPGENCRSGVQLKGSSVLDGLSELARKGFVKFPLPQHLHSAVSCKRNYFNIVQRSKQQPLAPQNSQEGMNTTHSQSQIQSH